MNESVEGIMATHKAQDLMETTQLAFPTAERNKRL